MKKFNYFRLPANQALAIKAGTEPDPADTTPEEADDMTRAKSASKIHNKWVQQIMS